MEIKNKQHFLEKILDEDGSSIDNFAGMILETTKKKSRLDSLLGGLFGR